jgi:nucleotide-binding universal stress UspA family protein
MTNLLVGVDGSDGSRRAAFFARDLARQFGAKLTLLYVVEPLPIGPAGALEEPQHTYYERQLQGATALLRDLSDELEVGSVDQVVEMGRAGEVICREGEERNADLIVVGSRGQSAGARFLMGSVVDRVAVLASRSVAIVR